METPPHATQWTEHLIIKHKGLLLCETNFEVDIRTFGWTITCPIKSFYLCPIIILTDISLFYHFLFHSFSLLRVGVTVMWLPVLFSSHDERHKADRDPHCLIGCWWLVWSNQWVWWCECRRRSNLDGRSLCPSSPHRPGTSDLTAPGKPEDRLSLPDEDTSC